MFENIEIRRADNGFILIVTTEDETKEYVFDSGRKAMRFIKPLVDPKGRPDLNDC